MGNSPFETASTPEELLRQQIITDAQALVAAVTENPELTFGEWCVKSDAESGASATFTREFFQYKDGLTVIDNGNSVSLTHSRIRPAPDGVIMQSVGATVTPRRAIHFAQQWRAEPALFAKKYYELAREPLEMEDAMPRYRSVLDAIQLQRGWPSQERSAQGARGQGVLARFNAVAKILRR